MEANPKKGHAMILVLNSYYLLLNHKVPTSLLDFNKEARNRRINIAKFRLVNVIFIQILPVSNIDKMVQANMFQ